MKAELSNCVLTVGADANVRLWAAESGVYLGKIRQGGKNYMADWGFPYNGAVDRYDDDVERIN